MKIKLGKILTFEEIEEMKQKAISSNDEKWKQKIKEEIEKQYIKDFFTDDIDEDMEINSILEELKTSLLKDDSPVKSNKKDVSEQERNSPTKVDEANKYIGRDNPSLQNQPSANKGSEVFPYGTSMDDVKDDIKIKGSDLCTCGHTGDSHQSPCVKDYPNECVFYVGEGNFCECKKFKPVREKKE